MRLDLVGADREAEARRLQPVERPDHTGEEEGVVGEMVAVMVKEVLEQGLQPLRRQARARDREAALDQGARPRAEQVAGLFEGKRRLAVPSKDDVQGADEVARGLGEGPVEIEHDDRGAVRVHRRPGAFHCQAG